jgi:hypothetical protein
MGLVYGVGMNDYGGGVSKLKEYAIWKSILFRVYSPKSLNKYPTYVDCSVCSEWLSFSKFKQWWDSNYIDGYHLDKDLLKPGNKRYDPDVCVFIPRYVNNCLNLHSSLNRELPTGITIKNGKYRVRMNHDGLERHIGVFSEKREAVSTWKRHKSEYVDHIIKRYTSEDVFDTRVVKSLNYFKSQI